MGRMSEHQLFSDTEIAIRSEMYASLNQVEVHNYIQLMIFLLLVIFTSLTAWQIT